MEGVGGLSGNNNSCMISYGEHNNDNGFSPMIMMPQIGSSSSSHTSETGHNGLFFPPQNTNHHDPNRTINAGMILEVHNTATNNNNYNTTSTGYYFMDNNNSGNDDEGTCSVKAKIMAHPHYHRLLAAFANCQKIGAPPEVVAKLEEGCASAAAMGRHVSISLGQDPALDQFMEAYCEMLIKYEEELSKPFEEAMLFLSRIESQFKALDVSLSHPACPEAMDRNVSSSDDMDVDVDMNRALIDPEAKDRELKGQLLRKYSGHLGGLKQEFMKKRKKGKLPKEARQQLLQWWSNHYKWPYPSEAQKIALAESTGLDQKQINNWFINQRKRHWKPSEDMQFAVVMTDSSAHHQLNTNYNNYHNVAGNINNVPFSMDLSPAFL